MDTLELFIDSDLMTEFLQLCITYGLIGAFAAGTIFVLITYAIFKALDFFNTPYK